MFSTTGKVFQRSLRSHNGVVDSDFVSGNEYHADSTSGRLESTRFYNNGKPRSKLHVQHVQVNLPSTWKQDGKKKMYRKTPAPDMFKKKQVPVFDTTLKLRPPVKTRKASSTRKKR